ncbi:vWA domain-containing protein [Methylobacillus flagellatus]|uniref:vWA domain-containing protein n=1 Tax=Methylobacillus flagellatus TaxID=405 RepID=UPI0010F73EA9|nr:vWA domain-containing protein [Methylobacillus flagellatus]
MKKVGWFLRAYQESLLYGAALLLLLLAVFKPEIQLRQNVHNYLLLADVSQSMNAEDAVLEGRNVSRMAYVRHLMRKTVESSPCGTYVSLGVFAAENVALTFMPLEVCANYDVIVDSIDHLEWRMSWRGNSRLSFGVKAAATVLDSLNAPAQMLFFTDGDEAPKVNAINKLDLSGVQIGKQVIFVGVGGKQPVPIPRYNSNNQWVGFWAADAKEFSAGAVGVTYNDTSKDDPDPVVASAEFDRYLSQLEDGYLRELAQEIGARYIEAQDDAAFYRFLHAQPPVATFVTAYSVRWLYLLLAIVLVLGTFYADIASRWLMHRRRAGTASTGDSMAAAARYRRKSAIIQPGR